MPIELYYWGIKGRAAVIRILLKYLEVDFVEKNPKSPQEYAQWGQEAQQAKGLNFINLPFIVDGDFALSESQAIAYYICKKFGKTPLYGANLEEEAQVQELLGVIKDLATIIGKSVFNKDHKAALEMNFKEGSNVDKVLGELSRFLGNKTFLLGDDFRYPDLDLASILSFINMALLSAEVENLLDKYENLKVFARRVLALPRIGEYVESEEFKKMPNLMPGMGAWLKDFDI